MPRMNTLDRWTGDTDLDLDPLPPVSDSQAWLAVYREAHRTARTWRVESSSGVHAEYRDARSAARRLCEEAGRGCQADLYEQGHWVASAGR